MRWNRKETDESVPAPREEIAGLANEARQEAEVPAPGESGSDLTADIPDAHRRQVKLLLLAVGAAVLLAVGLIVGSLVADHIRNQTNVWEIDTGREAVPCVDEAERAGLETECLSMLLPEDYSASYFDDHNVFCILLTKGGMSMVDRLKEKNVRLYECRYTSEEIEKGIGILAGELDRAGALFIDINHRENCIELLMDPSKPDQKVKLDGLSDEARELVKSPMVRVVYREPTTNQVDFGSKF